MSVSMRSQARFMWCSGRILLDSGEEACRRSCDSNARSDGEDGEESGGLCEHGVGCAVRSRELLWVLVECRVRRMSRKDCRNAPQMSEREPVWCR